MHSTDSEGTFSLSLKQRYVIQDCIFGASSHSQSKSGSPASVKSSWFLKITLQEKFLPACRWLNSLIGFVLAQTSAQFPLQSETDQTSVYHLIKEHPHYQVIKLVQRRKGNEQREQDIQSLILKWSNKGQRQTKKQEGHVSAVQCSC